MLNKPIILSTKKISSIQKQELEKANITLLEEDFISINYKKVFSFGEDLGEALIFTSKNAVQSVLDCFVPRNDNSLKDLKTKNVFCVGIKTKSLLEENGFSVEAYADYAEELSEIILKKYDKWSFTFFCGNLRRDVLPNVLKENRIKFNEIEVYETILTSKKIAKKIDGILFFSPSAVASYLKLNTIEDEICFCIGETTAEALKNKKVKNVIIAKKPLVENVIDVVTKYFKN